MNPRFLGIVLAISVAFNLFAVAAGVTVWMGIKREQVRVAEMRTPVQRGPLREVLVEMDPEVRDRVRATMRASALAARPDFEASRAARRRAAELAAGATLDSAAVAAALEASRTAEMRGRVRLESDAVALLGTLEASDRAAFSRILKRRGSGGDAAGQKRERTGRGDGRDTGVAMDSPG